MQLKLAHGRIFGLVLGLAAATAATAVAQDTTGQEETGRVVDTSQVENPEGYQGMERDTTLVPPSATNPDSLLDSAKLDSIKQDSIRLDSIAKHGQHTGDSVQPGETTPKKPEDATDRLKADSAAPPE
jgi:hypothetical protein